MVFLAAVLREFNTPLDLVELQEPDSLAPGQVWVQFHTASICGAQIGEIAGAKGPDPYLPHLLGHEGYGKVLRVGPGVRHVKPDDLVVAHWRKGLGMEAPPPKYRDGKGGSIGAGPVSTFAEYGAISENRLTPVSEISPGVGALLGCAATTGVGAVVREANTRPGESVLVIGAGGVGLSAVMGARLINASPICAVDKRDDKLRLAFHLGASICCSWQEMKRQFDVVIETTGNPALIEWGLARTAANGGRLILVGQPVFNEEVSFANFRQHYFGKRIMDSQGGGTVPQVDIPRLVRLYEENRLPLSHLITDSCPLEHINKGIDAVCNGEMVGRCVITM
jgi:S-(hydroxymethyl)glutathione dehydrogenase / alcohol dehydrogenase